MKDDFSKLYAIIAMVISLISFGFMIASLIAYSFAFWVYGVIIALFSTFFYFIDGIISIKKVFMKINPVFNSILAIMLIIVIPMFFLIGQRAGVSVYIWNAYYLAIFVLEIVSIVKQVKLSKIDKNLDVK